MSAAPRTPTVAVPAELLWRVMDELKRVRTSAGHRASLGFSHTGHCPTDRPCLPGCVLFDQTLNEVADLMIAFQEAHRELFPTPIRRRKEGAA